MTNVKKKLLYFTCFSFVFAPNLLAEHPQEKEQSTSKYILLFDNSFNGYNLITKHEELSPLISRLKIIYQMITGIRIY